MFKTPIVSDEATPSEGPAPAGGAPAAPAGPASSDVNWVDESSPQTETPEVAPQATPPAEKPPVVAPSATPATPPAPAAPVVPAAPAAAPPVQPAQPVVEATPPVQPEAPAQPQTPEQRAELRNREIERLTTSYALNQEDAAAILTSPETVVPKMLAHLHVNVCDAIIGAIMGRMPDAVQAIMENGRAAREAEDAFYSAWPALKDAKYRTVVGQSIQAYRALNPRAQRDEMIRAAGLNAMIYSRLPIPPELLAQPPAQPATPQPSFTPAAPAGAPGAPAPAKSTNPFVLLNEELDEDDRR